MKITRQKELLVAEEMAVGSPTPEGRRLATSSLVERLDDIQRDVSEAREMRRQEVRSVDTYIREL